jgi:hypothetical protein
MLGCLEEWWLGGIYSPNHQNGRWGTLLSTGAPDRSCSLFGVPSGACFDSARAVSIVHCSLFTFAVDRRCSRYSAWHTG